ncbi:MAG: hypothetical protein HY814_08670 [Candidatus Riflebacteria bacterium]|nr:hypothetical protein [Candidatus Riflebacteria bacterium]
MPLLTLDLMPLGPALSPFPAMDYVELSEEPGPRFRFIIGPRSVEQLRRTVRTKELATRLTREDLDTLHGAR